MSTSAQTYNIDIDGYWRDVNKGGIPSKSGIYCVYSCVYDESEETVSIQKLIYIGESADVNARVANHEKYSDWKRHLRQGEELCFSFGPVDSTNRERVEAALIFKHKPPENTEYVDSFPFDQTTIRLTGKTAKLNTNFTVFRT